MRCRGCAASACLLCDPRCQRSCSAAPVLAGARGPRRPDAAPGAVLRGPAQGGLGQVRGRDGGQGMLPELRRGPPAARPAAASHAVAEERLVLLPSSGPSCRRSGSVPDEVAAFFADCLPLAVRAAAKSPRWHEGGVTVRTLMALGSACLQKGALAGDAGSTLRGQPGGTGSRQHPCCPPTTNTWQPLPRPQCCPSPPSASRATTSPPVCTSLSERRCVRLPCPACISGHSHASTIARQRPSHQMVPWFPYWRRRPRGSLLQARWAADLQTWGRERLQEMQVRCGDEVGRGPAARHRAALPQRACLAWRRVWRQFPSGSRIRRRAAARPCPAPLFITCLSHGSRAACALSHSPAGARRCRHCGGPWTARQPGPHPPAGGLRLVHTGWRACSRAGPAAQWPGRGRPQSCRRPDESAPSLAPWLLSPRPAQFGGAAAEFVAASVAHLVQNLPAYQQTVAAFEAALPYTTQPSQVPAGVGKAADAPCSSCGVYPPRRCSSSRHRPAHHNAPAVLFARRPLWAAWSTCP